MGVGVEAIPEERENDIDFNILDATEVWPA